MNKVRVVVFIEEDSVRKVISDGPVEVVIVDSDINGLDDTTIVKVLGEPSYVYEHFKNANVDAECVCQVFKDASRLLYLIK